MAKAAYLEVEFETVEGKDGSLNLQLTMMCGKWLICIILPPDEADALALCMVRAASDLRRTNPLAN